MQWNSMGFHVDSRNTNPIDYLHRESRFLMINYTSLKTDKPTVIFKFDQRFCWSGISTDLFNIPV